MAPRRLPAAALLLLALTSSALAEQFTLKVVSISDGDTLTGLDSQNRQIKVRLHGIDAWKSAKDSAFRSPASVLQGLR